MSEPVKVIDTSTLSEVLRQRNESVQERARNYLAAHQFFTFSIMTRFEILRGLHAKGARRQLERFEIFCSRSNVLPLDDPSVARAAKIYGVLRQRGLSIDDVDILIAATAMVRGMSVISENVAHFSRVPELQVESWRSHVP